MGEGGREGEAEDKGVKDRNNMEKKQPNDRIGR